MPDIAHHFSKIRAFPFHFQSRIPIVTSDINSTSGSSPRDDIEPKCAVVLVARVMTKSCYDMTYMPLILLEKEDEGFESADLVMRDLSVLPPDCFWNT